MFQRPLSYVPMPLSAVLCCAKMLPSCLTLCDPMDHSPSGSSGVGCHALLQGSMPLYYIRNPLRAINVLPHMAPQGVSLVQIGYFGLAMAMREINLC